MKLMSGSSTHFCTSGESSFFLRMKEPLPERMSKNRRACKIRSASRTQVLLTCSIPQSCCSDGSLSPIWYSSD